MPELSMLLPLRQVRFICTFKALLDDLPEFGDVQSTRDSHTLLTWWQRLGQRPASLLARLGFLESALGDDRNLEALLEFGGLASHGVPFEEGNLTLGPDKDSGDRQGVVKRRTSGDSKGVTATERVSLQKRLWGMGTYAYVFAKK